MKAFRIRLILGAVALATALALVAPAASAQDSYTLKRVYKVGEVDKHKTTVDIESDTGLKLQMLMTTSEKVKEVKDDGTVTLETTVSDMKVLMNGSEMPMPGFEAQTVTSVLDKDGKVIKTEGGGRAGGQAQQLLSMTRQNFAPGTALKVGETLKLEVPPNEDKTKKMNVEITLVGLEKKSADLPADALKVKTIADGTVGTPAGEQKLRFETTSYVAPDTSKLIRLTGVVTGMTIPNMGAAKIAFKVIRAEDEKPAAPK